MSPSGGSRVADRIRRVIVEFVVVVVGVLIALTADRWVQALDERAAEENHIAWLTRDLVRDSIELEAVIAAEARRERLAGEILLAVVDRDQIDAATDSLVYGFKTIGWSNPPTYATATWSELVAAGRLSLIGNDELRRRISRYYEAQDDLGEVEDDWEHRFKVLEDFTIMIVPDIPFSEGSPAIPGERVDAFRSSTTESDWARVRRSIAEDPGLRAMVGYAGTAARVRQRRYRVLLDEAADLLSALREG